MKTLKVVENYIDRHIVEARECWKKIRADNKNVADVCMSLVTCHDLNQKKKLNVFKIELTLSLILHVIMCVMYYCVLVS